MISRSFDRPDRTTKRANDAKNRYKMRFTGSQDRPRSPRSTTTTEFPAPTGWGWNVTASIVRPPTTAPQRVGTGPNALAQRPPNRGGALPIGPSSAQFRLSI